ncbi:NADPH-dependent FMN reductase [Demequina iriomotensis]|uniref:NADPH-dependent FMN reductase n=1 Tax=Demequina iriomotensis TaxID=1536641 RepID=UPI000785E04B|nr:NAD(P)H-dependent oxidoreductase [Demequina iriomotensis]
MVTVGLLVGHLPQARAASLLAGLLRESAPDGATIVELEPTALPAHAPFADTPLPEAGVAWRQRIEEVDGLLVVAPTHGRSVPGSLKHLIDWACAEPSTLEGKPVVIAGAAAPGAGTFLAMVRLRSFLTDAGAAVMGQPERQLTVSAEDFESSGACRTPDLAAQASVLAHAAAEYVTHVARVGASGPIPVVPSDPVARVRAATPGPASPAAGMPSLVDTVALAPPVDQQ